MHVAIADDLFTGKGFLCGRSHVFEDQLERFIRPFLPRFTISPTAAACLFDELKMWVFHQRGASKTEEQIPPSQLATKVHTHHVARRKPNPDPGVPNSSEIHQRWSGGPENKVSSRGDFGIPQGATNPTLGPAPFRIALGPPSTVMCHFWYISHCQSYHPAKFVCLCNQTRIWLSSTRPSKLWKDGSIPLGPAGIKIRCEKEGIPGCFSHSLRKSQVAIALGWGPWRAM